MNNRIYYKSNELTIFIILKNKFIKHFVNYYFITLVLKTYD